MELRDFLHEKVYFNPDSRDELEKTEKLLTDLYQFVLKNPDDYVKSYSEGDSLEKRTVDFIAGMTDRYALGLYEKISFPRSMPVL